MNRKLKVACLQLNSADEIEVNLAAVTKLLEESDRLDVLVLPENFAQMPASRSHQHSELSGAGEVQTFLSELAQKHRVVVIGGSLPICQHKGQKPYARSLVFDSNGQLKAYYDKLHLFDVEFTGADGRHRYSESNSYLHGETDQPYAQSPVRLNISGCWLNIGLTICYDLRFPEQYRGLSLAGAQLIVVPAAFTADTGEAHWRTLLRARAIENQVFILAAAQTGLHANGRKTWGHSMIIDPWGEVLAELGSEEGLLIADIDLTLIQSLRAKFPVLEHRRLQ